MTARPTTETDVPLSETARTETSRSLRPPIIYAVLGLAALILFGLTSPGGTDSTFGVSRAGDFFQISPVGVPSRLTATVLGIVCLVIAGYSFFNVRRATSDPVVLPYVFAVAWVLAFLIWAIAGKEISFVSLLQGSLILAVPLVFGSMAGILCERSGVINIAIEGQLLAGAFLGAVVATMTGSNWLGLIAAVAAGIGVSAILAVFTIKYAVNQIIVGVVVNVLVLGLTSFLYSQVLAENAGTFNNPSGFVRLPVPLLADIPLLGPILFDQSVMVYLMYAGVIALTIALFKTKWGLRIRAVGEHPQAADTLGVKVNRMRWLNVLLSGVVAGVGGAFFTLGSRIPFDKDMTSGKGFIALAAMIFGRWHPVGAFAAALLFGFADNLQNILGILRIPVPSEFLQMAPYLATIFAVAGLVGRSRPPAASGEPYIKGE